MKIKMYLTLVLSFFLMTNSVFSESRYVTERMRITLRAGPDISYKVRGLVSSGESVEMLERREKWTRVETSDGKDGWVMSRFLTTDIPKKDLLERLEKDYQRLKNISKTNNKENDSLKKENRDIKRELSKKVLELKALKEKYDKLNEGCKKYTELKKNHDKVSNQINHQQSELAKLKEEKAVLESNQLFWGFGLALGVLAVGFMIGKSSQRKRTTRLI